MRSAALLFEADDYGGACSRAYYAMFNAALAAVEENGGADPASIKTHSGLIATFHKIFVRTGLVDRASGRALSKAFEVRLVADYSAEITEKDDAAAMIERSTTFVETVFALLIRT